MPKRTISCQQDPLGDRLRREALETRPAFSEALHERIVSAICSSAVQAASSVEPVAHFADSAPTWSAAQLARKRLQNAGRLIRSRVMRIRRARIAVAAACFLLAAGGLYERAANRPAPIGSPSAVLASAEPANRIEALGDGAVVRPAALPDSVLAQSPVAAREEPGAAGRQTAASQADQLVYHDARRAARALLKRLPLDLVWADATAPNE